MNFVAGDVVVSIDGHWKGYTGVIVRIETTLCIRYFNVPEFTYVSEKDVHRFNEHTVRHATKLEKALR